MRHLDHLLGGGPEVVGELRPLDDDPDPVVEAGEAVGGAQDVILGERAVEDPAGAELLLHSLGDVEDAALLPARDVLPPEVGVGVLAEELLEREVHRFEQGTLRQRHPRELGRRHGGGGEAVALRPPRLRKQEVVDRRGVGIGGLAHPRGALLVGLHVRGFERRELRSVDQAVGEEPGAELRQGVARAGRRELIGGAVELVPVGVRMGVDPHAFGVDERAAGAGADVLDRGLQGPPGVEVVGPVAVEDPEVPEAGEVVGGEAVRRLLLLRYRDPEAVVLDDEDDREPLARGAVDGFVEVPLGGRRLAHRAENDRVGAVGPDGAPEPGRVLGVVGHHRGDVLDAEGGLGEMVRHVAAAAGDVVTLGEAVEEDLLDAETGGETGRQIPVVGEEVVVPRAEGETEGDLDPVVAGTGGVVRPAEPLLEVVRSLVVEHPGLMHEGVGATQLRGGNVLSLRRRKRRFLRRELLLER